MKVKMKDNLIMRYQQCPEFDYRHRNPISSAPNELIAIKESGGYLEYFECKEFLKSIEGKIVELVFTGPDAFEKNDDNYWLPNSLWAEIV